MKLKPKKIREYAFEQLFISTFCGEDQAEEARINFLTDRDLQQELELIGEQELTEEDISALKERCDRILAVREDLDRAIDAVAVNWKTSRMSRVDLSILRLALFEMRYDDRIPLKVAINEAVELAKKYGGDDSPAFVNAILGKLAGETEA